MTTIIAFRDISNNRVPISHNGRLVAFPTHEAAKYAAGWDGVSAAEPWERVLEVCERYKLEPPEVEPVQLQLGGMA